MEMQPSPNPKRDPTMDSELLELITEVAGRLTDKDWLKIPHAPFGACFGLPGIGGRPQTMDYLRTTENGTLLAGLLAIYFRRNPDVDMLQIEIPGTNGDKYEFSAPTGSRGTPIDAEVFKRVIEQLKERVEREYVPLDQIQLSLPPATEDHLPLPCSGSTALGALKDILPQDGPEHYDAALSSLKGPPIKRIELFIEDDGAIRPLHKGTPPDAAGDNQAEKIP